MIGDAYGREGLFNLVRELPRDTTYEHGVIVAEGDFVMMHGRYRDPKGTSLIVVDVMRIENGTFQEHWDVMQDEAKAGDSKSGLPMFGDDFPEVG